MTTQPEAILEHELIQQLNALGYAKVTIRSEAEVLSNFKLQLERFNRCQLNEREFNRVLNHLNKGNVFDRAKTLRDRYPLVRDDGETIYLRFFNDEDWSKNLYQVTNQVTVDGQYKNRYDVTLLVNGLPLVQVELKRRGLELKEAFNQILRYSRHSYWTNSGLFQYIQLFVISNGVNTKYYANTHHTSFTFKQTFYWADKENRNITDLAAFASAFLLPDHLGKMIAKYVVMNETYKTLMVLRPYQYYAVEAIVDHVKNTRSNGYIWHTTGSGKTLTSFKAAQVIMTLPHVHKVVFVVDRKDLDYQTANEFNAFKKDSVDMTEDTRSLVNQLKDDTRLVVTTIQKLNNAIQKQRYEKGIGHLKDKRIVFIFDECHRSQFGDTHKRITGYFNNAQMFGFTGTPIFAENAYANDLGKRTTKVLFHECLHKYVITDAIRDQNVLKFAVEYIGRFKQTGKTFVDIEVEAIDTREAMDNPKRLEKIVDYIIKNHPRKTHQKEFTAMFAVSGIDNLILYYDLFKKKKQEGSHDLRVVTIFTYGTNEEDDAAKGSLPGERTLNDPQAAYQANPHSRNKLDEFIRDYNQMYGTNFNTQDPLLFEGYYKDISNRIKNRERDDFNDKDRVDLLLVVNIFLTGFDAKKVNTLFVDKNLKHHGLVQAYSRTNRILDEKKSQGNIVCFRNLKDATDKAIALFSNKDAKEVIFLPPYEELVRQFAKAYGKLLSIAPTVDSVKDLADEEEEMEFIQAFREIMRLYNVLKTFTEFSWDDLPMKESDFENFKSAYLDLFQKVRSNRIKEKDSILEDVDFELELIHRDEINVAYILKLLARLKNASAADRAKQMAAINNLLNGDIELRSKRDLIEKFIRENLPKIANADDIPDEFDRYWEEQKVLELNKICEEEHLDSIQFKNLIDAYIYSGRQPLPDEVFLCLENRPSVLKAREVGDKIIARMMEFVEVFVMGVGA